MAYPPPPYADAVCGTHLCGEAICGAWWAYPPQPGLLLGGEPPVIDIILIDVVPAAGLKLGAWVPDRLGEIDITVAAPQAGLLLGAILPAFRLSTVIVVTPAGLLLGAYLPTRAGTTTLIPIVCIELPLVASPAGELVLVGAVASDLVLDPLECL